MSVIKVDKWQYLSGDTAGEWQSWTPTYTGFTISNGTVVARYTVIGNTVSFYWQYTVGSSDSYTGALQISMPVAPAYNGHLFNAHYRATAAATYIIAAEQLADNEIGAYFRLRSTNDGQVGNLTLPATGRIVVVEGSYEK